MNTPSHTGFVSTLTKAAGFALQWRVLLLWMLVILIPTALATLPWWQVMTTSLSYSAHAGALAHALNANALADIGYEVTRNQTLVSDAMRLAGLLTFVLAPFLCGVIATAARSQLALTMGKLVHGGISEYWRMLRLSLFGLIPLGLAGAIGGGAMHWASGAAEKMTLESQASNYSTIATIVAVLVFVIADAIVDAGRATFVHSTVKRSALKALWSGLKLVLGHPLRAFGPYVILTLAGLVIAAVLGLLRLNLGHVHVPGFLLGLILTQLIAISVGWMKGARIYALAIVAK